MANLVEMAKNALGMGASSNSLYIPEATTTNIQTPVYVPPTKQEFDWTVPDSEKPAGTEDWTWSRSLKAKQLFDNEQIQNEESAYKKFTADYQAYTDALNLAQKQQEAKQKQVSDYYTSQGLVAPVAGDPTGAIRQLGQMYRSTTDPNLKAQLHQQAIDLAKQAGWIQDGQVVDSVNSLPSMTMAGTPTFENQYKTDALNYEKQQDAYANSLKAAKTQGGGSSGSSSGNTDSIYDDAIEEMLDGQSRHRQAILSGETRNPHSYNYYVNMAIQLANKSGKSLTQSQINALLQQASYLSKADEEWKASR